jgi:putative transposase
MSRFKSLAHSIWHCHYHIVWVPKYRYRILKDQIKEEVESTIRRVSLQMNCEIEELNVQDDHVHLLVMVPPKIAVSKYVGTVKGKCAIRIFSKFRDLKTKLYWGNHFWARGYCVDTVGLDLEKIKKYVQYQEKKEKLFAG